MIPDRGHLNLSCRSDKDIPGAGAVSGITTLANE
jgi:hypothetical protein